MFPEKINNICILIPINVNKLCRCRLLLLIFIRFVVFVLHVTVAEIAYHSIDIFCQHSILVANWCIDSRNEIIGSVFYSNVKLSCTHLAITLHVVASLSGCIALFNDDNESLPSSSSSSYSSFGDAMAQLCLRQETSIHIFICQFGRRCRAYYCLHDVYSFSSIIILLYCTIYRRR
jgi:hypothetical protein